MRPFRVMLMIEKIIVVDDQSTAEREAGFLKSATSERLKDPLAPNIAVHSVTEVLD